MVKYASESMFVPGLADYVDTINMARMREERAERARQALRQQGIAAMLVAHGPNIRYLTGHQFVDFQPQVSYVLFFAEHDPVLFAAPYRYLRLHDFQPWIKHWRLGRSWLQNLCGLEAARKEAKLFAQEIRQELQERGLVGEKLGVTCFDHLAEVALGEAGLTVVDAWPVLVEASKIKTQDEVACLKVVASICGKGFQRVLETLRPGVTEAEVSYAVRNTALEAGAETASCGMHSGTQSAWGGGPSRRIEYGDMGCASMCGTSYMGYTACIFRSFIVGRQPTDREKDMYKRLLDRINAAIEATKVGNTTADAAKAFPPASSRGFKDEAEVFTIEIGHGIGLVSYPPCLVHYNLPVVNRQWSLEFPQPFEKGMVIAYESLEGEPGVGGLRLENMTVITEDGAEILDRFPRDEILVAGA